MRKHVLEGFCLVPKRQPSSFMACLFNSARGFIRNVKTHKKISQFYLEFFCMCALYSFIDRGRTGKWKQSYFNLESFQVLPTLRLCKEAQQRSGTAEFRDTPPPARTRSKGSCITCIQVISSPLSWHDLRYRPFDQSVCALSLQWHREVDFLAASQPLWIFHITQPSMFICCHAHMWCGNTGQSSVLVPVYPARLCKHTFVTCAHDVLNRKKIFFCQLG